MALPAATVAVDLLNPASLSPDKGTKPLKVFILAGQSNMEGKGFIKAGPERNEGKGSLEYPTKDNATANKFMHLVGKPVLTSRWAGGEIQRRATAGPVAQTGRIRDVRGGQVAAGPRAPRDWGFDEYCTGPTAGGWYWKDSYIKNGEQIKTATEEYNSDIIHKFSLDKRRDWKNPRGHYAIAQFSPWVLWLPDGLNLKQGTNGELFGYGYLPMPLTAAKKTTAGQDVPTGNQCSTLFLNTGSFKGPVTVFVPYFWSKPTVEEPELAGLFLDTRPSDPNNAVQMETQHVLTYAATDAKGDTYACVVPIQYPARAGDDAPLIPRIPCTTGRRYGTVSRCGSTAGRRCAGASPPRRRSSRHSRAAAGRRGRFTRRTPRGRRRLQAPGTRSLRPPSWMRRPRGTGGVRR